MSTRTKHWFVQALLGLHALGWVATAFQAVQVNTASKPGVSSPSPDMIPMVFMLLSLAAMSAALTWWVRSRNPTALAVAFASFGVIGVAGLGLGGLMIFASFDKTDPYIGPVGAVAFGLGLVHAAGSYFALQVRNEPPSADDSAATG